jgi:hypothetical protein
MKGRRWPSTIARVARLPLFAGATGSSLEAALDRLVPIPVADGLVLALAGPSFLAMVSGAASIRGRLLDLYDPSPAATIAVP